MPNQQAIDRFVGFEKNAMQFWHELAEEMNRDWFLRNKQRYEAQWVRPMTALLGEVTAKLAKAYSPLVLAPPKVMRIHRDVRFSADKAPYKTHIGAVAAIKGRKLGDGGPAAMYIHIGKDEDFVGVGTYMFDARQLAKWRKLVAGKQGAEIEKLIGRLRKAGYEVGGHDDYKRVPRGFDPDHPRAALLKLKGLTASPPDIPRGLIHKPDFAKWIIEHGRALAPLVIWLHKNLG
jgi:uncharacterized protein (TIGR02453 family)